MKNLRANAGDVRDWGSIPGSGKSPGGGNGNPLQYSCLGNPMDRGAWRAIVHGVHGVAYSQRHNLVTKQHQQCSYCTSETSYVISLLVPTLIQSQCILHYSYRIALIRIFIITIPLQTLDSEQCFPNFQVQKYDLVNMHILIQVV